MRRQAWRAVIASRRAPGEDRLPVLDTTPVSRHEPTVRAGGIEVTLAERWRLVSDELRLELEREVLQLTEVALPLALDALRLLRRRGIKPVWIGMNSKALERYLRQIQAVS